MADWSGARQALVEGFQVGQATGGGRLSQLGSVIKSVADRLRTDREKKETMQEDLGMKRSLLGYAGMTEGKIVSAQPNEPNAFEVPGIGWMKKAPTPESEILNRIFPQGQGQPGQPTQNIMGQDWKMNKVDLGPVTLERTLTQPEIQQGIDRKVQETQAQELAKGIPTSESGKVALARESIKNIQDVKKYLFPTGKATSFKRTTAFASNLPGGNLPILASRGWGKAEQEVYRKMGASLAGRQLIQTGVAARPEETQKLISQFAPSGGSNSVAALNGLNELESFYKDYLNTVETRGIKIKGQAEDFSQMSDEELRKIASGG